MLLDVLKDTFWDCLKELPFLFMAFLILEAIEQHMAERMNRILRKAGSLGPLAGAVLGCVPQCGFSVMASEFYAGGVITLGTLMAVFLSTSDEAAVILMSCPGHAGDVLRLIGTKVIIAAAVGYLILAVSKIWKRRHPLPEKEIEALCRASGHREDEAVFPAAVHHTFQVFVFLFAASFCLSFLLEMIGMDRLSGIFFGNTVFQPLLAALIGLIPNCAASVLLTQLYLDGVISFGAAAAGLCSAAGFGLIVLFRINENKKENLLITGLLLAAAVCAGMLLQLIG